MLKYDDKPSLLYLRKVIQIKDWITARPHWPHCDQSLIHWSMNLMTSAIIKSRGWFVCWLVWVHLEEDRDVLSLAIVACLFCPASQRHRCVHKQMSQVLINPEFCLSGSLNYKLRGPEQNGGACIVIKHGCKPYKYYETLPETKHCIFTFSKYSVLNMFQIEPQNLTILARTFDLFHT